LLKENLDLLIDSEMWRRLANVGAFAANGAIAGGSAPVYALAACCRVQYGKITRFIYSLHIIYTAVTKRKHVIKRVRTLFVR